MVRAVIPLLLALTISVSAGDAWTDAGNPVRVIFKGARLDLWSLQPVRRPQIPDADDKNWVRQPVDSFILQGLQAAGLRPAPEAGRRILARRLARVLTGLPPEEKLLEDFCRDESPGAWDGLVEALLASPDFGVNQARMWLDTVRYSDSNGYDWDEFRPSAWRYRDYVVRAFQQDKPFDRFIREQLAGDELVEGAPVDPEEQDSLIATGFLRMGPQDNSAKLFGEEHRARAAIEADLAETTATAFLGMTLRCCRCHDHKTDPLTHEDHYRLRAFFTGVKLRDDLPIDQAPEQEKIRINQEAADAVIATAEGEKKSILTKVKERLSQASGQKAEDIKNNKARDALTEEEKAELGRQDDAIRQAREGRRKFTVALGVSEDREKPLAIPVLSGGDPDQPKHPVEPGIFTAFRAEPEDLTASGTRPASRRLALADWLVARENPLTARVIVNRIWQQCFGEGLVATPDDFGYTGSRPTHPELLDWLADNFVREGWSVKRLMGMLVRSAAWRQSAWVREEAAFERGMKADAAAALLWHAHPRRLTAEQVRDSLLWTAGKLTQEPAGPPVWPELPPEVLQANPAFLDDNAEKTKGWYPSKPEQLHVRSLRLVRKRSVKIPFMEAFDQPDNFESCTRRMESTGAPQALTLMNHPLTAEVAQASAARIRGEVGADLPSQLNRAFTLILQRPPEPGEVEACLPLLEGRSLAELCRVLLNTSEFLVVE